MINCYKVSLVVGRSCIIVIRTFYRTSKGVPVMYCADCTGKESTAMQGASAHYIFNIFGSQKQKL